MSWPERDGRCLADEYHLSTVPIAIGAGHSPFAALEEHLKLDVVEEQRFRSELSRRPWCPGDERPVEFAPEDQYRSW